MKRIIHLLLITALCFANAMAMESERTDEAAFPLFFQEGDGGNITVIGSDGKPLGTLSNNSAKRPRENETALEDQPESSKRRTETQSTPKTKKRLSKLNILSIRYCESLTDKSIQHLANARGLTSFTAYTTNITDDAVRTILLNCRWLQQLNLQNCYKITGSCFHNLPPSRLMYLKLSCTNITDDVVSAILSSFPSLQALNLRGNGLITGSCFQNMQHNNLRILELDKTNIAYKTLRTLISNHPNITFYVSRETIYKFLSDENTEADDFSINASIISRVKDPYGNTPLNLAVINGHTAIARALLDAGANTDTTNNHGDTPLHSAAINGDIIIAMTLVDAGANTDVINNYGETALMIAQRGNHHLIVKLLEKQQ